MKKYLSLFTLLFLITTSLFAVTPYNRKEYGHWIKIKGSCLDTRGRILKERSLVPVTIEKCRVTHGKWEDFYYKEILTEAKLVDIDHIVPVEHAHQAGAYAWPKTDKRNFYNDLENLVVTNRSYNRQKGNKDITHWMPVSKSYACKYALKWKYVKEKYKLTLSEKESEYIKDLNCISE